VSKGPEAQTQALILDYLAAKGVLTFRMNSGAMRSEYKGKQRFMRFGSPGMADLLAFRVERIELDGIPCDVSMATWIECKAPKGKQSDLQRSFQQQVERHGHRYVLARSLEDVQGVL